MQTNYLYMGTQRERYGRVHMESCLLFGRKIPSSASAVLGNDAQNVLNGEFTFFFRFLFYGRRVRAVWSGLTGLPLSV